MYTGTSSTVPLNSNSRLAVFANSCASVKLVLPSLTNTDTICTGLAVVLLVFPPRTMAWSTTLEPTGSVAPVAEISNDPPMNILKANIGENKIKFEGIDIDIPKNLSKLKDKNFNLGIRASDIELSDNGFEFEVELAEISGSETLLHLKRGDAKIITSIEEVMNFNIHDKVKINFNTKKFYAFNESGILASSPFGGSYV